MNARKRKVVIVGGGVTGTAALWVLSRFTNIGSIALLEKYSKAAQVNSNSSNNSQTLHWGDIETNYDLAHALPVKDAARLMQSYVECHRDASLHQVTSKMVLGVGEIEVAGLMDRYRKFKDEYPNLQLIGANEIGEIEPNVMKGRDPRQPVAALLSSDGYAINYQKLSESFIENAVNPDKQIDVFFNTTVDPDGGISRQPDGNYVIRTNQGEFHADAIIVCAGPWSLIFAQSMGLRPELAFLNVAGSFYKTDHPVLNGKVYTVQTDGLPFAAVHGDPDVAMPDTTRFGPTAKIIPQLERHRLDTTWPYLSDTKIVRFASAVTMLNIARDPVLTKFMLKNVLYDWRVIGKRLYIDEMRKIVPSLRLQDIELYKGAGGTRPQIFDTSTRQLLMGESSIFDDRAVYNTTPSPGASVSLKNGERDAKYVVGQLGDGFTFDQEAFDRELRPAPTNEVVA